MAADENNQDDVRPASLFLQIDYENPFHLKASLRTIKPSCRSCTGIKCIYQNMVINAKKNKQTKKFSKGKINYNRTYYIGPAQSKNMCSYLRGTLFAQSVIMLHILGF